MNKELLKDTIFPIPKSVVVLDGEIDLTSYEIIVQAEVETAEHARQIITDKLSSVGAIHSAFAEKKILLTIGSAPKEVAFPEQGYKIEMKENSVTLTGFGSQGLHYAAVTLCQLIKSPLIQKVEILDWPDMEFRGHIIETRLGSDLMEKQDWFDMIDDFASQKINHLQVNMYGCWCVQYDGRVSEYLFVPLDGYPDLKTPFKLKYYSSIQKKWIEADKLPPMFEKDFFAEVVTYGKARGITVFPGFNSYGHNTLIPNKYPDVSAKDENGEATRTGFCTSNKKTYDMLFDIYDQILERYVIPFGIDCFALGLDEVWAEPALNAEDIFKVRSPWCTCPSCKELSPGEMFVEHTVRIIKYLKNKGMKRIFMYCDMLIDHGPNGVGVLTEPLVNAFKREGLMDDVVITWWTYADLYEKLMFHSTKPELGLHRVTTPWNGYYHWCVQTNSVRDIYMLAKMANDEACDGMHSYSSYDRCFDRSHHLFAEFSWSYNEAGSIQDATDRYLRQNFSPAFEDARRAFHLFDLITEERIENLGGNSSCLSNYFMLRDRLSYYFYSYVEAGKPYPRIFPGEALEKVCANKDDHIRAMCNISSMAKEALAIWENLISAPECNQEIAKRYAYEAENYKVLVDDYLAMLRMMEMSENGEYDTVAQLALNRKNARIALMARLEETKEAYHHPWNLRNHSIFMQFFDDLYNYIKNTPHNEIILNFFDMRYLESEKFKNLR